MRGCPQRPALHNPNNSPQFAKGHSLRISLSADYLIPNNSPQFAKCHSLRISLSADYLIPNNSPQFAKGHSLRLSRLSALRLVTGRCSLGSATRTVHRTVRVSAPLTPVGAPLYLNIARKSPGVLLRIVSVWLEFLQKKIDLRRRSIFEQRVRDSNPCYRRERPAS